MKEPINYVNIDNRKSAIKWIKEFNKHKEETFCTICEKFNCDCGSSNCFKITNPESVIAFLRYVYAVRENEFRSSEK